MKREMEKYMKMTEKIERKKWNINEEKIRKENTELKERVKELEIKLKRKEKGAEKRNTWYKRVKSIKGEGEGYIKKK